jgi:flagellar hook assembly protein FlgD
MLFLVTSVFAANFSPSVLKISAPATVQYNFDGSNLQLPVTFTGGSAQGLFLIYTKDKADKIGKLRNGYLGWHYVNKVDTCMYVSPVFQMGNGSQHIVWDGKDSHKNAMPKGDYTYYIWAYDHTVQRILSNYTGSGRARNVLTHDDKGLPRNNPLEIYGGIRKWTIGNDPMDSTLVETTSLKNPFGSGGGYQDKIAFDKTNATKFWAEWINWDTKQCMLTKYDWVSNGQSTIDLKWGEEGHLAYPPVSSVSVGHGGVLNLNNEQLITCRTSYHTAGSSAVDMIFTDFDEGTMLKTVDLADWWSSKGDMDAGGQMNGGPHILNIRDKYVFLTSSISCHKHMLDPTRENQEDWFVWANDNGDYVGDHNFEPDAKLRWVCNDWNVGPYMYTDAIDQNLFMITNAYGIGAVSFGLFGPDGTGLGYFAFYGETDGWKKGQYIIDYGSAFDGIYTDWEALGGTHGSGFDSAKIKKGSWFVPSDSFKGTLSSQVKVAESAPAAFSVAQNTPNPFNPNTTISFTLAKAGHTTIDVFNSAGQKVDTILNANLSAGAHSVNWNAASHSAGVYFYTVRSGDFSKTLKMTLLK